MSDVAAVADAQETQFDDSPSGWAKRWTMEFASARREVKKWHKTGEDVVKRFLDERQGTGEGVSRRNYFSANIITQRALIFGKTPKVDVTRRFADANDVPARVAGETLQRLLNTDIETDADGYSHALEHALDDRLLAGLGMVKVRYAVDGFETAEDTPAKLDDNGRELAPAVPGEERAVGERVEVDYFHWKDVLWSPCRIFEESTWWAFRAPMRRSELVQRFGEKLGNAVPLNSKKATRDADYDGQKEDPWSRADVWEIWSKPEKKVFWFVEGYDRVLDVKDDPYELSGFWPFPRPLMANLTTSKLLPKPDYKLAEDLYNEIDEVSTRITALRRALKVAGVYDKNLGEDLNRLIDAGNNVMIPVANWAMFGERGGLKGAVDWFPLEQVVSTMDKLRESRAELVSELYQLTGMSDIMRGQASEVGTTATEQSLKARFASVRMQRLQDEFAQFASAVQRLKAELIARLFAPATIVERSNILNTPDSQYAEQAVELIKSQHYAYRVEVKPEAVSMTDFAAMKQERTEFLTALSGFLTAAIPAAQAMPGSLPSLLELLKWGVQGFRGASSIEGVLDQAIARAQQLASMPQANGPQAPDPKVMAQQQKAQADAMKTQMDLKADLIRTQAETQALEQRKQIETKYNLEQEVARQKIRHAGALAEAALPPGGGIP